MTLLSVGRLVASALRAGIKRESDGVPNTAFFLVSIVRMKKWQECLTYRLLRSEYCCTDVESLASGRFWDTAPSKVYNLQPLKCHFQCSRHILSCQKYSVNWRPVCTLIVHILHFLKVKFTNSNLASKTNCKQTVTTTHSTEWIARRIVDVTNVRAKY